MTPCNVTPLNRNKDFTLPLEQMYMCVDIWKYSVCREECEIYLLLCYLTSILDVYINMVDVKMIVMLLRGTN